MSKDIKKGAFVSKSTIVIETNLGKFTYKKGDVIRLGVTENKELVLMDFVKESTDIKEKGKVIRTETRNTPCFAIVKGMDVEKSIIESVVHSSELAVSPSKEKVSILNALTCEEVDPMKVASLLIKESAGSDTIGLPVIRRVANLTANQRMKILGENKIKVPLTAKVARVNQVSVSKEGHLDLTGFVVNSKLLEDVVDQNVTAKDEPEKDMEDDVKKHAMTADEGAECSMYEGKVKVKTTKIKECVASLKKAGYKRFSLTEDGDAVIVDPKNGERIEMDPAQDDKDLAVIDGEPNTKRPATEPENPMTEAELRKRALADLRGFFAEEGEDDAEIVDDEGDDMLGEDMIGTTATTTDRASTSDGSTAGDRRRTTKVVGNDDAELKWKKGQKPLGSDENQGDLNVTTESEAVDYNNYDAWLSGVMHNGYSYTDKEDGVVCAVHPVTGEEMGKFDKNSGAGTLNVMSPESSIV